MAVFRVERTRDYRFYVEDASGSRVQKEFPGTESKSETESLLRKAMEDYETKMFLAQMCIRDSLDIKTF